MKRINGDFFGKSIISVEQFSKKDIEIVFDFALHYKKGIKEGTIYNELSGKILTALFYEPSSRTFGSFVAAMQRLGGGVIPIHGVATTSVVKGESLSDTIKTFASYSDAIVLRHPEEGMPLNASKISNVPIINAGDGVGEHPTQGLLDLFTIKEQLGKLNNLKVALVGDLAHSRTAHSLAKLIALFSKNKLYFIAPPLSPMPEIITREITQKGISCKNFTSINKIIEEVDVLYITRVQKERMSSKLYQKIKNAFKIDNKLANRMKKQALIMSPLPRVGEIDEDVDINPRATYLKYQMRNGMFIRMVLLRLILKR